MSDILGNLSDPSWWFTAFLVAIIASVIAGFLKDYAAARLGEVWEWYRNARHAALAAREAKLQMLVDHPELLSVEAVTAVGAVVVFLFSGLFFLLIPIWTDLTMSSANFRSWAWLGASSESAVGQAKVLIVTFGLMTVVGGFQNASRLAVVQRAQRRLRSRLSKQTRAGKAQSENGPAKGNQSSKS